MVEFINDKNIYSGKEDSIRKAFLSYLKNQITSSIYTNMLDINGRILKNRKITTDKDCTKLKKIEKFFFEVYNPVFYHYKSDLNFNIRMYKNVENLSNEVNDSFYNFICDNFGDLSLQGCFLNQSCVKNFKDLNESLIKIGNDCRIFLESIKNG